jgi:hypothetical protein
LRQAIRSTKKLTPFVSDEEMEDIEKRLGEEGFRESEFVDAEVYP